MTIQRERTGSCFTGGSHERRLHFIKPRLAALTVAMALSWTPVSHAIDLADFDPERGVRIAGNRHLDLLAANISGAGDINGDGIADVVIGAPFATARNHETTGAVYVLFGSDELAEMKLDGISERRGFAIYGAKSSGSLGYWVSGAGDVNGDGLADLIVGDRFASVGDKIRAGRAYVIYGKKSDEDVRLDALTPQQGFRISGPAADSLAGVSVAGAGDVNGDGLADVVLGVPRATPLGRHAAGSAYVIFGRAQGNDLDLANLSPETGYAILGESAEDYLGFSVSGAGDFDGDGLSDVIVSAPLLSPVEPSSIGIAYVVYGHRGSGDLDLKADDQTRFMRLVSGRVPFGGTVSGAGDVNGDGWADVVFDTDFDAGPDEAGFGQLITGRPGRGLLELDLANLGAVDGYSISGQNLRGSSQTVFAAGAGDTKGDGLSDVLIGSQLSGSPGRGFSGMAFLVHGDAEPESVSLDNLAPSEGQQIVGAEADDALGESVSSLGDINGDGLADFGIISPRSAEGEGMQVGAIWLIYGERTDLPGVTGHTAHVLPDAACGRPRTMAERPFLHGYAVGVTGDGSMSSTPDSRAWLRWCSQADEIDTAVTVNLAVNPDTDEVALPPSVSGPFGPYWYVGIRDVVEQNDGELVLRYLDSDVEGVDETRLRAYAQHVSEDLAKEVWSSVDPDRNLIRVRMPLDARIVTLGIPVEVSIFADGFEAD